MTTAHDQTSSIVNSLNKLTNYIEAEDFKGYDPYDILHSKCRFLKLGKWSKFVATQLHKRNPINARQLLGIHKSYNPKGMGLLLYAYSLLYRWNPVPSIREKMDFLFDWLCSNYSKGYSGYCWGLDFPYSSRINFLPAYMPSTVVTAFVGSGIFEYYMVTKNPKAREVLRSCCDFILCDLPVTEHKNGICFSYTPTKKDVCFNATMLGAELLASNYFLSQENKLKEFAKLSVDFTVAHQHSEGKWSYSIDKTGKDKIQVDFHQGFILNSLYSYMQFTGDESESYKNALIKGANFYYHYQFLKSGQSLWRIPKKWPVDIHNQSQGSITFCKLAALSEKYLPFAERIALWTIDNMQDTKGFFYYRKGRFITNRIPYMRWSQAWMMTALTTLINSIGIKSGE